MKIAFVVYGGLDAKTGGTLYDRLVVEGLRRRGDEVHVLAIDGAPSVRGGVALARRIARSGADVVVGDELCFRELAIAFPLVRRSRRVLLVHHLTSWEHEIGARARAAAALFERAAIASSDLVVTTSETTRARLSRARRRIEVARPGCDRLPIEPRSSERIDILFIGALVPRKRVPSLVRAFVRGAHDEARLVLVGSRTRDTAHARVVADTIDALGARDRVIVRGELSDAEIARALARAAALVLPSSLEGWGIAATEAIRAGTPVVASRTPGLVEALAPYGEAATFFDGEDDLARCLGRLTREPGVREAAARAAALAAPHLPTWDACVEAFRAALTSPTPTMTR